LVTCQICKKEHSANQEDANFHHMVENAASDLRLRSNTAKYPFVAKNISTLASNLSIAAVEYKSNPYNHSHADAILKDSLDWALNFRRKCYDSHVASPDMTNAVEILYELNALSNPNDMQSVYDIRNEINQFRSDDEQLIEENLSTLEEGKVESAIRSIEEPNMPYKVYEDLYEAREKEGVEGFEHPDVVPSLPPLPPPPFPRQAKPKRVRKPKVKRPQKDDETHL